MGGRSSYIYQKEGLNKYLLHQSIFNFLKSIVHISEANNKPDSGMGRISFYWSEEFKKRGYKYIHIGPDEIGKINNRSFFGFKALRYFIKLNIIPSALIVHEPLSGYFTHLGIPTFLESHGIESRYEHLIKKYSIANQFMITFKSKIFSFLRLLSCAIGLKYSSKLLLSNSEDASFVKYEYKRNSQDIFIFNNGVMPIPASFQAEKRDRFTVMFNGSFIPRKGISTLIEAAKLIAEKGIEIDYLLVGTGLDSDTVHAFWPEHLHKKLLVVSSFEDMDEIKYLSMASVFVLPSFFEGQPLSLLQAMSFGVCSITTNCCGQKDIITHEKNGFLFEPGDHVELSRIISQLVNDDSLRESVGKKGKEILSTRTWDQVAGSLVNYVEENLAQH